MSFPAANPLAFPTCPRALSSGLSRAFRRATTVANCALLATDMPTRMGLQLRRASAAKVPMRTLLWRVSAVMYPVLCSVTATGPFRRPAALGLLLRVFTPASQHQACRGPRFPRPFRVSVPPKTSLQSAAQNAAQTSFGPSQKADLRPWEPGPLARLRPV